ncbi:Carboxylesterase family [Popillia japonica]|uniref:Carboxylesterase family n=1 Tax=Popillia japonica TaxID=7064 RepID=A0AAW1L3R6_POPJA
MYNANDEQKKNKACYSNAADKSTRQTSPGRIHSIKKKIKLAIPMRPINQQGKHRPAESIRLSTTSKANKSIARPNPFDYRQRPRQGCIHGEELPYIFGAPLVGGFMHFGRNQRQGCIHGEELPYIFGAPLVGGFMHFGRNYTKSEVLLAETTMIYWSNFARTGNPNEPPEADISHGARQERNRFKNIEWTAYEAVHKKYLNLDTKPKLKNHYRAHRLSFWLNLVPDLHKPGGDDVPRSHHDLPDDEPPPPKLPSLNPRKLPTTESPDSRSTPNFFNYSALATIATSEFLQLFRVGDDSHVRFDGARRRIRRS